MSIGTFAAAQLLKVLPRKHIARAVGMLCDAELSPRLSRAVVGLYSTAFKVDLAEAVTPNGENFYPTFDAFFTRQLQHDARKVCTDASFVSPVDGRLDAVGVVTDDGAIWVKGRPYSAVDLLGDDSEAKRYQSGQYAVFYLSPADYHRVHTPIAGTLVQVRSYPGDVFPVNEIGFRHIPRVLVRNRRVAMALQTKEFGRVTLVMVAAMFVGRITVSGVAGRDVPYGVLDFETAREIPQGGELGAFHLGSTVVLFSEAKCGPRWSREPGKIIFGDPLDKRKDGDPEVA